MPFSAPGWIPASTIPCSGGPLACTRDPGANPESRLQRIMSQRTGSPASANHVPASLRFNAPPLPRFKTSAAPFPEKCELRIWICAAGGRRGSDRGGIKKVRCDFLRIILTMKRWIGAAPGKPNALPYSITHWYSTVSCSILRIIYVMPNRLRVQCVTRWSLELWTRFRWLFAWEILCFIGSTVHRHKRIHSGILQNCKKETFLLRQIVNVS